MSNFEVAIIGGGIVGTSIFSKMARSGIKCVLLEAGEDVSLGCTKANSGIVHAGFDCAENTLKAKLNVEGNLMFDKLARRLGEKIKNCGSLVVSDEDGLRHLQGLKERGIKNGVKGLVVLKEKELKKMEPNLGDNIKYGLFAPSAKLVSPYNFCVALVEEGIINGGKLMLNFKPDAIFKNTDGFVISNKEQTIESNYLINCAGYGVNDINKLLGDEVLPLKYTRGSYILLDKSECNLVHCPIFPLPTVRGKGMLVLPTVSGNMLLGPTAEDVDGNDTQTTLNEINNIKSSVSEMVKNIDFRKTIKLYAGVRVKCGDDFYIQFSKTVENYLIIAGICSPGLSAAPAIAEYAFKMLTKVGLKQRKIAVKKRRPYTNVLALSDQKLNQLIQKDGSYGKIVCKCENITEGEIKEVLKGPIKPLTTDGIKRRLRPTMGRCQGSFCYPKVLEIMSNYYKVPQSQIAFKGSSSVVVGNIKEGGIYGK